VVLAAAAAPRAIPAEMLLRRCHHYENIVSTWVPSVLAAGAALLLAHRAMLWQHCFDAAAAALFYRGV